MMTTALDNAAAFGSDMSLTTLMFNVGKARRPTSCRQIGVDDGRLTEQIMIECDCEQAQLNTATSLTIYTRLLDGAPKASVRTRSSSLVSRVRPSQPLTQRRSYRTISTMPSTQYCPDRVSSCEDPTDRPPSTNN
jgi:hypothetical protein